MAPQTTTTDGSGGGKYTLEPGRYWFRVLSSFETDFGSVFHTEEKESGQGNPQIQLALEIGNKEQTVTAVDYLTFTDKAAWRISSFLKAAGVYPGSGVDLNLTPAMCIGLTGLCETLNEIPKNGKYERTKVKEWIAAPEQHPERLTATALNSPASDTPPPPSADEEPVQFGDNDPIPF